MRGKANAPRAIIRHCAQRILFKSREFPWSHIELTKAERKGLNLEELQAKRKAKWLLTTIHKNGETIAPLESRRSDSQNENASTVPTMEVKEEAIKNEAN